jgi:hypothetical protein
MNSMIDDKYNRYYENKERKKHITFFQVIYIFGVSNFKFVFYPVQVCLMTIHKDF